MNSVRVCVHQAPYCSVVGPGEKVLLFRHQHGSEQQQQSLQRLAQNDHLQDGDLIQVIISGQTYYPLLLETEQEEYTLSLLAYILVSQSGFKP